MRNATFSSTGVELACFIFKKGVRLFVRLFPELFILSKQTRSTSTKPLDPDLSSFQLPVSCKKGKP